MAPQNRREQSADATSLSESTLLRLGSRAIFSVIIIIAFLTLVQCTVEKPKAPSWDTNLTIPLINRTYPMDELIRKWDQEGVQMDSSGSVFYTYVADLDTLRLDSEALSTDDLSFWHSEQLGTVSLDPPATAPLDIDLRTLAGIVGSFPGDSLYLGPQSFTYSIRFPGFEAFTEMTVANGRLTATVDNWLGLDLTSLTIAVYDVGRGSLLGNADYPGGLPSGRSQTLIIPLDGRTVSNEFQVGVWASSPAGWVTDLSQRFLRAQLAFGTPLEVFSATARIPGFQVSFSEQADLDENDLIDTARLASGRLDMTITNNTGLPAQVSVTLPDFVFSGQPLTVVSVVPARDSVAVQSDLARYDLAPAAQVLPQVLLIDVDADISGSGSDLVTVYQTDSISVAGALSTLSFESVTGVFQSTTAMLPPIREEVDVPDGLQNVEFVSAIVTLDVDNGVDLPGNLDLHLTGDSGNDLSILGSVAPRGLAQSSARSTIINDQAGSFLSPPPTVIEVSGCAFLGDGHYRGTIRGDDFVFARVTVHAPLEVRVRESRLDMDVGSEKIDQEDIHLITEHVTEARLVYSISNHLPVGARISFFLDADSTQLDSQQAQLALPTVQVPAGVVSPLSGLVTEAAETGYNDIILANQDVKILENDTLFIGTEIVLDSSDGQAVKFTRDDYLAVIGRLEVIYRVDGEF